MTGGREFDVVVVGGGVGGVAAVRKLASIGLSVALVEDRLVGGECHYWGCNPSKTLLRPIEVFNLAKAVPGVREIISAEGPDVARSLRETRHDHRAPLGPRPNSIAAPIWYSGVSWVRPVEPANERCAWPTPWEIPPKPS